MASRRYERHYRSPSRRHRITSIRSSGDIRDTNVMVGLGALAVGVLVGYVVGKKKMP
jgi:hypothetical protein